MGEGGGLLTLLRLLYLTYLTFSLLPNSSKTPELYQDRWRLFIFYFILGFFHTGHTNFVKMLSDKIQARVKPRRSLRREQIELS